MYFFGMEVIDASTVGSIRSWTTISTRSFVIQVQIQESKSSDMCESDHPFPGLKAVFKVPMNLVWW